jgi:hypothetical protein
VSTEKQAGKASTEKQVQKRHVFENIGTNPKVVFGQSLKL